MLLGIIITICLTFIICVYIYNNRVFKSKLPQNICSHEMDTIKTREGEKSSQYLSTCKKCGYQTRHSFEGINGMYGSNN